MSELLRNEAKNREFFTWFWTPLPRCSVSDFCLDFTLLEARERVWHFFAAQTDEPMKSLHLILIDKPRVGMHKHVFFRTEEKEKK